MAGNNRIGKRIFGGIFTVQAMGTLMHRVFVFAKSSSGTRDIKSLIFFDVFGLIFFFSGFGLIRVAKNMSY